MRKFDGALVVLYNQINEIGHKVSTTLYDYIGNVRTIAALRIGSRTALELDQRIRIGYPLYIKAEAGVSALKWFSVSLCTLILEVGIFFTISGVKLTSVKLSL